MEYVQGTYARLAAGEPLDERDLAFLRTHPWERQGTKTHEELLREIESLIRVEPGDLQTLPDAVRAFDKASQELLCAVVAERDEAKGAQTPTEPHS